MLTTLSSSKIQNIDEGNHSKLFNIHTQNDCGVLNFTLAMLKYISVSRHILNNVEKLKSWGKCAPREEKHFHHHQQQLTIPRKDLSFFNKINVKYSSFSRSNLDTLISKMIILMASNLHRANVLYGKFSFSYNRAPLPEFLRYSISTWTELFLCWESRASQT